ncbi:MAG: DedA family protein [Thermoleophilia bacterium]
MSVHHLLTSIPPGLVYLLVGLIVGAESMGIPLPGETTLATAALLSVHHDVRISPWGVAIAGSAGAIIGDSIGYGVGRRWGNHLLEWLGRKFPRHASPAHILYAEDVFRRRGVFAVFFGRFVALLRIFAGPIAGALKMPYIMFLPANAAGGILWAGGTTLLIYRLGKAAEHWLSWGAWIALGLAVVLAVIGSRAVARRMDRRVREFAREHGVPEPPT